MSLTSKYSVINIRRYLKNDNPKIGEDRLLQVLSGFPALRILIWSFF